MNTKKIITTVLAVFVFASIAYLIASELNLRPPIEENKPSATEPNNLLKEQIADNLQNQPQPAITKPSDEPNKTPDGKIETKVLVYYFHGNVRCVRCKKFEAYTQQALTEQFAEQLQNGRLQWKIINVEKPGNNHFINDYNLVTKSIIISKIKDGKEFERKNLVKIWQLVDNEQAFKKYILDETEAYLGAD